MVTVDAGPGRHRCSNKLFVADLEYWVSAILICGSHMKPFHANFGQWAYAHRCSAALQRASLAPSCVNRYVSLGMCGPTMEKKSCGRNHHTVTADSSALALNSYSDTVETNYVCGL